MRRPWTTQTDDDDVHGGHRRPKRSSASLPVRRRSPASHRSWVLLNRTGARRDGLPGDRTTSATSRTSIGGEISLSFELVEPPGTSVLTVVDWPPASTTTPGKRRSSGNVVAAHRDVALLAITSYEETPPAPWNRSPPASVNDLFVYHASLDPFRRRRPSLLLLPSAGRPEIYCYHYLGDAEIGVMSCTSNDDGGDSPPFVVAELRIWQQGKSNSVRLFRSVSSSGQWDSFENLHVHGANGGRDLRWWSTDAVVPYGRRQMMIWVDYYRGMILMDRLSSSQPETTTTTTNPPRLRYVPLPVDMVGDPNDSEFGSRGCPKASRSVCVTRSGIKFISVDCQHWSDFGVGHQHVLKWSRRFRISTWWLREDDDGGGYTWRKDATMHEQEFWDVFDRGGRFPHDVQPEFPVVDMENPDVVVFRLERQGFYHRDETKWMIEVDLRKKVLLAATSCCKKESDGLSGEAETINSAIVSRYDPMPSELPRYLDGGQDCKRRRQ